jgi:hypothetical protein
MAARLPTFNLFCNIWKQWDVSQGPPRSAPTEANVPCNLQFGPKRHFPGSGVMYILLPRGTDVQSFTPGNINNYDIIECPAGSGRWYIADQVDDVAKGFPTEHRCAEVGKAQDFVQEAQTAEWLWPVPYP